MAKKQTSTAITPAEHVALVNANAASSQAKSDLLLANTYRQLQAAKAELAQLRVEKQSREEAEQVLATYRTATTDFDASSRALGDLMAQLRKTHGLTEHHAIDAESGAILSPENLR